MFCSVVVVDPSLSHLDRAFTYAIPGEVPVAVGSLVRVPFRRKRRNAVVVDLMLTPDVERALPIAGTVGPGLDPSTIDLARWVADRYLATLGEALAAALPQRVASEEDAEDDRPRLEPAGRLDRFAASRNGDALIASMEERTNAGFLWRPRADEARADGIVALVGAAVARGGGALVLLPEVRAGGEVAAALRAAFGDAAAWLGSDRSPRARYRDWLALRAGRARVAIGGRGAVFAPLQDLRLVVVDDEGHASYKEGRAPRFHARTVAAERARRGEATLVLVGIPGSIEARAATERGPYTLVAPSRAEERGARPPVTVIERERTARLTPDPRTLSLAARVLGDGKRVVILAHRAGTEAAAIAERAGRILKRPDAALLDARTPTADLRRAIRAAPLLVATPVLAKDLALDDVGLLAIVGADGALAQPEFRAPEDAFATWWRAARWAWGGAIAIETAEPAHPAIVALTRWDPDALWRAEAVRRRDLGYPPFASLARIDVPAGRASAVAAEVREAAPELDVLGPVERAPGEAVVVVRARRRDALLDGLRPLVSRWRADDAPMRVDVDPWEVLVPKWRS